MGCQKENDVISPGDNALPSSASHVVGWDLIEPPPTCHVYEKPPASFRPDSAVWFRPDPGCGVIYSKDTRSETQGRDAGQRRREQFRMPPLIAVRGNAAVAPRSSGEHPPLLFLLFFSPDPPPICFHGDGSVMLRRV
jgi:hypothetical protein